MEQKKIRPIQRSLLLAGCLFIAVLCIALAVQANILYTNSLYSDRNSRLESAITYVEHSTDADDLLKCVKTGKDSPKRQELQQLMNVLVDDLSLDYLYLVIPIDDEVGTMMNVVSATSEVERAAGMEDLPILYVDPMYYYGDYIKPYLAAMDNPEISYFEEESESGACYTACKPLVASNGETVCLICADIYTDDLREARTTYVLTSVVTTIIIGAVFAVLLMWWFRRRVTGPLQTLEERSRTFTETPREDKDLESIRFDTSDIQVNNEVGSLAGAVSVMVDDIRHYMQDSMEAEQRVADAEREMEGMTQIAYQDALTKVRSKAAYDQCVEGLTGRIEEGTAAFGIVMVDLNDLKTINDTYGHENGDKYIIGACRTICLVYEHSPVYRVGGDEFVVVLEELDYQNRDRLLQALEERFEQVSQDEERKPWARFSAAVGMAVYDSSIDLSVEEVYGRADAAMYENKKTQKGEDPE